MTGEGARRQPSEASDALTPQGTPITTPESDCSRLPARPPSSTTCTRALLTSVESWATGPCRSRRDVRRRRTKCATPRFGISHPTATLAGTVSVAMQRGRHDDRTLLARLDVNGAGSSVIVTRQALCLPIVADYCARKRAA